MTHKADPDAHVGINVPDQLEAVLPRNKHGVRVRTYVALLALDVLMILLSFTGANLARFGNALTSPGVNAAVMIAPLYVVMAAQQTVYGIAFFQRWRETAWCALRALALASAAVLFAGFYLKATALISREIFTFGVAVSAAAMVVMRWAVHRWTLFRLGGEPLTELVIRDAVVLPALDSGLMVDAGQLGLRPDIADPAALDRIGRLLRRADRVVVACPVERRAAWAAVLKGSSVRGELACPELDQLGALGASSFAGMPTLLVSAGPLDTRNRLLKRALDTALALGALVLLAPLLGLVGLAVWLESGKPILFIQPRLGRGNRLFDMYKFRSMRADACDLKGHQSTRRDDSRITRVGRVIRATSIDELPQILNVLKGEMSVVGPRPHALGSLAGDKLFWEVDQRYWHRHAAKPGLTGLAQVRGFRGATHHQTDLTNRLQADLEYLNGWTVWRDLRILIATVRVVLHKNAY